MLTDCVKTTLLKQAVVMIMVLTVEASQFGCFKLF